MKKFILFLGFVFILGLILLVSVFWYLKDDIMKERKIIFHQKPSRNLFDFQAIDTMKYSRDLSREKMKDISFDAVIERQVKDIADSGATHIAIATPYDQEFLPMLDRWVKMARKYKLKVWFRGNWSGWEGWFEYPKLSRVEHLKKTEKFILDNEDIFEDGDAFSSCPECENGGDGDPRQTGDINGYRKFLIDEYNLMNSSFDKIGKDVRSDLFSMNGDVAKLIMDKNTTKSLGGVVTIDHYVATPEKLIKDIDVIAKSSGGKVVLGEFGAPIPDIHGKMTEAEQAKWIAELLNGLQNNENIGGMSYWLNVGGSTEIWRENGESKLAAEVIKRFYKLDVVYGAVFDEMNSPIKDAKIEIGGKELLTDKDGYFVFKFVDKKEIQKFKVSAKGYHQKEVNIGEDISKVEVVLNRVEKDLRYKCVIFMRDLIYKYSL